MDRAGIRLGRFLGAPVLLSGTWFVLALVVLVSLGPSLQVRLGLGVGPAYGVALLYAVLLLLSVLAHELAHAATARAMGQQVHEIVVHLMGGHTEFSTDLGRPGRRALVAAAGPLANAAIAVAASAVAPSVGDPVVGTLVDLLAYGNAALAVLNLLPGLPLDGGAVVESFVWGVTRRRSLGTVVAGWGGRVVAVGFVLVVLVLPLVRGSRPGIFSAVWSLLIAASLWQGATAAIQVGRLRGRAGSLRLSDHVEPAVGVPAATDAWATVPLDPPHHVVVLDPGGAPVGLVDAARLRTLHAPGGPPAGTPATAVMTVLQPAITMPATAAGDVVLETLAGSPAAVYVVTGPDGRVVGVASGDRLAGALTGASGRTAGTP
ncbi:M50 family metallopeptidase [Angustibacter aerolatus]|uniref:Peptidase M50 n=1 Tax=Angustibacter aerolatus TaxID=1162965 RepID=A0ABQ6JAK1_9ACTN|nr:M50 family metallopeptidase [Angustibacter aerolatus]GMA84802.1 peptidase M50 [Angustibacter aerolatus]